MKSLNIDNQISNHQRSSSLKDPTPMKKNDNQIYKLISPKKLIWFKVFL